MFRILLFLISLSSCGTNLKKFPSRNELGDSNPQIKNFSSVLSLSDKNKRKKPRINLEEGRGVLDFGPSPEINYKPDPKEVERQPVIALILGPGINRVLGHIALLKSFRKFKVPWHVISGEGLSSIIASYTAMGETPEKIEWLFYKFFNETKNVKPYSIVWMNKVESIFLNNIEKKKLENLKFSTVIPIYDRRTKEVFYKKKGSLTNALRSSLYLNNMGEKRKYSSSIPWEVFNSSPYNSMGVDLLIGIDVIGDKLIFEKEDEFLIGVFGKVSGRVDIEKNKLDLYFKLPMSSMPLDSLTNAPSTLQEVQVKGEEVSKEILNHIKKWRRDNATFYE